VASLESDQVEVPPNHAMEDADWVHEGSRWKCKINGCTDAYVAKWWLNGYFVSIWTTNMSFAWRYANMVVLLLVLGDQGNKITML
jgi:hypothetical protein